MEVMSLIGNWLEGSGWVEIVQNSCISTPGRVEHFLTGKSIERTRYAHQVTLYCLGTLYESAKKELGVTEPEFSKMISASPTAKFWYTAIELEHHLFAFIHSIRTSDFPKFIKCLKAILPWTFALGKPNYCRSLSEFVHDMETLDEATRDEFEKGYFTIQKTRHQFSALSTDQAHEQLNVIVKAVSGPIGELFNTPELVEWGITVPVLSAMTKEAFDAIGVNVVSDEFFQEHHENTDTFESDFRNDCKMLLDAFEHFRNPFTMLGETNTLINIMTGRMYGAEAVQSVFDAKRIGIAQATLFMVP